ncbi:MAG: choice-of-anchor D domain-containing protein [Deltaproteobacteria bacterium]|nr:choice-of-anchor D domain-containing protein [Deltaproteobacteria bacterium]
MRPHHCPGLRLPGLSFTAASCLALLLACGDEGSLATVRPKIVVVPDAGTEIAFERVVLTRTKAAPRTIQVRNEGDGPLSITSIGFEGAPAGSFDVMSYPRTLAPGGRGEIVIRFIGQTPGEISATLKLTSNDSQRPELTWPVRALAAEPCLLYADQSLINFVIGDLKPLILRSLTSSECVIERISLDRNTFPIKDEPALPLVVPGHGEVRLEIEHRPVSSRQRGAPVRELTAYEQEGGTVTVLLQGEAPLFGCLRAEPLEIVFPQTEVGRTRHQTVRVLNDCGRAAALTSVVVSRGWDQYSLDPMTYPANVPPQGRVEIGITYAPQSPFGDFGQLVINTNDASAPQFHVSLNGTAAVPDITYFPTKLDFGSVIFRDSGGTRSDCSSAVRSMKVYSNGSAPLRIDRLEIDPTGDQYFEVTSVVVEQAPLPSFNNPFTVPVGEAAEITLQFYPTRSAPPEHLGRLLIHHNASPDPAVVELSGLGAPDGPVSDTFTQLAGPKADILWVIDNSCSMFDEQTRLINNLSGFVGYADSLNSDYQMGVTVTDSRSSEAGKLRQCWPHPRIISDEYPDREAAFRCTFEVGVTGPYLEAGLGAARQALLRAMDDSDPLNPNRGFLRDDASLAIVAMSDEEDQSLESDDLLRDFFFSIKGRSRVKVHAIAGPTTEPCVTDIRIQAGYRYERMARETGGTFHNICLEDWSPVLAALGLNVFTPISEWQLSQAAVPASVTVTVDGRPVSWSIVNGFTYDVGTNTVQFHGAAVPGPNQQIDVDYLGNCRP